MATTVADFSRLPGPVAAAWEWRRLAACRDVDPDVFFHPDAERGPRREARDRAARAVCATCPVIAACRRHALAVGEPYGVWGGLTADERERLADRDRLAAPHTRPDRLGSPRPERDREFATATGH